MMIVAEYSLALETAIGPVRVTASPQGITSVAFSDVPAQAADGAPAFLEECGAQLRQYFSGARADFHSLPVVFRATDFQQAVWEAAMAIPYGETRTYGHLAQGIGSEGAARAVGTALHRNPLCIIVPCHRIVPASAPPGECGGYAGGTWRKEWLLKMESQGFGPRLRSA